MKIEKTVLSHILYKQCLRSNLWNKDETNKARLKVNVMLLMLCFKLSVMQKAKKNDFADVC